MVIPPLTTMADPCNYVETRFLSGVQVVRSLDDGQMSFLGWLLP